MARACRYTCQNSLRLIRRLYAQGIKSPQFPLQHLEVLYDSGDEILLQLAEINQTLDKLLELFKTNNSRAHSEKLNTIQGKEPDGGLSKSGLKILLVEDEEIHQDISCKVLNGLDCSVDIAIDGLKAMDKLRSGSFDLVLMDLNMPQMDGMRTAQEIRNLDCQHRNVPIIGLSNMEPQDSDAFFAAGFQHLPAQTFKARHLH